MKEFKLSVGTDNHNFILVKSYVSERGKDVSNNIAYFPDFKTLLNYSAEHLLKVNGLDGFESSLKILEDLIDSKLKPLDDFISSNNVVES